MPASSFRQLVSGYLLNFQPKKVTISSHSTPGTVQTAVSSSPCSAPDAGKISSLALPERDLASTPLMANIPFDLLPFVPHGFNIVQVEGRNGVSWVIVPHRTPRNEDWMIATIHLLPDEVFFPNVRDVLEEFL